MECQVCHSCLRGVELSNGTRYTWCVVCGNVHRVLIARRLSQKLKAKVVNIACKPVYTLSDYKCLA